jgi:adenylate cyclase
MLAPEVRDQIPAGNIAFVDPPVQKDDAVRAAPLEVTGVSLTASGFPALVADFPDSRNSLLSRRAWPERNRIETASTQGITLSYFWINYTRISGPEPAFFRIPAWRLAAGELTTTERQALKQAIVLVGSAAEQGEDWHHIPGGQTEEGVAIQAQAVATLLDHQALGRSSHGGEALLTLCFLTLLLPFLIRLPAVAGLATALGAGVFWWVLGVQLFVRGPWLIPMAAPLTGLGAVFLVYHAARSVEEALARRHVERAFGHNVTPAIRDYLLASPQHLRLGGEETEASVLFFDLRGSTQFAESRSPHMVVTELNSLYEVIVPLIEHREGLLYRFLGDGFLAVFGAPRHLPDHARAACLAAMDIMQSLESLNTTRRAAGLEIWQAGCGVHTGRLVYGNLGAASRAEFTVIGNTVNLAARLEGLNKEMNSQIIISEAAYLQAGELPVAGPSERRIAGRQEPIRIYVLQATAERNTP